MRDFLNSMPGPVLTAADVAQRLKTFEDEEHKYPIDKLKAGCLALYEKEKAEGTELPAILGLLRHRFLDTLSDAAKRHGPHALAHAAGIPTVSVRNAFGRRDGRKR